MQSVNLILLCFIMLLFTVNIAYAVGLNYYSNYGVPEQTENIQENAGSLSIQDDPFGYSDQYTDSESGLQYLQVRYYNPVIMRFTEMDTTPLLNRYAYANENPIMDDDPSGHSAVGASNSTATPNFGETLAGNLTAAFTYYSVMEICNMIISAVTGPEGGIIIPFLMQIPSASGASLLANVAQSGAMHQSVTGKQVAAAAVGGALGGVFAGSISMLGTPILHDEGGFGFRNLATTAITGASREVGLTLGTMIGNTMFGIPNNVPQKTTYLAAMMTSLGIVSSVFINNDSFENAYETKISGSEPGNSDSESTECAGNQSNSGETSTVNDLETNTNSSNNEITDNEITDNEEASSLSSDEESGPAAAGSTSTEPGSNWILDRPVPVYRIFMLFSRTTFRGIYATATERLFQQQ